mgnify:FL=1
MCRSLLGIVLDGCVEVLEFVITEFHQHRAKQLKRFIKLLRLLSRELSPEFIANFVQVYQLTGSE